MKFLCFKKIPIKISVSFIIFSFIIIALGYLEQFFITIFVVSIHEFSHLISANFFGVRTSKINFTPLGQNLFSKDLEFLALHKKLFIISAGPLVNLILFLILLKLYPTNFIFFRNANLAIALFNFLPSYPLDGGRFLFFLLSYFKGTLKSNNFTFAISKYIRIIIYVLGLFQVVLYPFNISLICLALYSFKASKKEYFNISINFYKDLVSHNFKERNFLRVKYYYCKNNISIRNLCKKINYDDYKIFVVGSMGKDLYVSEKNLVSHISNYGIYGTIEDIINY